MRPGPGRVCYPRDLAREVRRALREAGHEQRPTSEVLGHLFEVLYFASLRTEESQPITCTVTYLDPKRPDPSPPRNPHPGRWSVTPLGHHHELTIPNLVKLSCAADPAASSLAVFHGADGALFIWGMIDQALQSQGFVTSGKESGPERPGIFHATVAPAHLSVFRGNHLVASLIHGQLTHKFHDVFHGQGRIQKILDRYIAHFTARVRATVGAQVYDEGERWGDAMRRLWVDTLCRVLTGVQSYRHGGAILLIEKHDTAGLNVKYALSYPRLGLALERFAVTRIAGAHARDRLWKGYLLEDDSGDLPGDLHLEEGRLLSAETDCLNEIMGCVRFIASLSRADGLVVMDRELVVGGFGVEITVPEEPAAVLMAGDAEASSRECAPVDYTHFGIRHRSMMRYCYHYPGSVGLVVSQDGTIRALTRDGVRLVLWETIQLF